MFDDGAHGDGSAGDHVYGVQVTADGVIFEYYIYAENTVAGLFSPQRAEHEFHTLVMNIPFPQVGEVVVNELMANNVQTAVDNYGENDDWIELYNTTSHAVDLTGLYLSDDIALYTKWAIPVNSVILPNSYLIVWADNDPSQIGLHTNFKLSSNGESLFFSNGINLYDQVSFSLQSADISYARCPDAGIFSFAAPTFNATNNCFAGIGEYFYHANIKTPKWLRYFIQTPELHSIHHQYDVHKYNFSDIPLWDRIFGTYKDTTEFVDRCGFPKGAEEKLGEMLVFKDVYKIQNN
jgi:hypothetical protein